MGRHFETYDEFVGVEHMLRKRISRYVDSVVSYLPLMERRRARAVITSAIYARIDDITGGGKPTVHEFRLILKEMGTPQSLAEAYYQDFCKSSGKRPDLWKWMRRFINVLTALALILVVYGMIELMAGAGIIFGFVVGLSLSVIVVFYQMLVQPLAPIPKVN